jgi:hypothetical protein
MTNSESLTNWEPPKHLPFISWHSVDIGPIDGFWCVIEIPKGSKYKYELDKKSGLIKVIEYYTLLFTIPQIMVLFQEPFVMITILWTS